jgi:hypothetical protein
MSPEILQKRAKAVRDLRNSAAKRELEERQKIRKEQKLKRETRMADEQRLKKLLKEATTARELARENADHKVDVLLAEGLAAALKRKGKTHERKLKAMLDKQFFTIAKPPDDTPSLAEVERDVDELDRKHPAVNATGTKEDQVAVLRFRQGTSTKDPPSDGAKNPKSKYLGRKLGYDYEYNYFEGKTGGGVVFNYQLTPAWCEFVFVLVFTQLCRRKPDMWFHVPVGNAHLDDLPSVRLRTTVAVRYRQEDQDYCLPYAAASCLYYMGYGNAAFSVAEAAPKWSSLPGDFVFDQLRAIMKEVLPESGQSMVFNKGHGHRRKNLSVSDLIRFRTPYLTVVQPKGNDGSADHAICVVDDLVFDARFGHALKLCEDTFKWVCGPKGVCQLGHVIRFCKPHGVRKMKHERIMGHNWE